MNYYWSSLSLDSYIKASSLFLDSANFFFVSSLDSKKDNILLVFLITS